MKHLSKLVRALFVLAACGGTSSPSTTAASGDDGLANPNNGEMAIPTGDAVNPQPITEATVVSTDGNEVRFAVWMGLEPCDVIDRVEVTETDASVDVEIFRGTGDIAATCVAIAVERIVVAELDAPLGARVLILSGVELAA
ncbi:MAG: hypothetical protein H0T94_03030 [Acidimicrobiia bacterium]|nr:hypothetical protein [Acidimicrobiia bacterium]